MKIIIVGTGFSGSIMARRIAEELNYDVELIEKRDVVGGNMYDYEDEYGIMVQKYGPHFLNTNNYWIIDYLSKYSEMIPYNCSLLSYIDDKYVRLPYNFTSIQQLVGYKESESIIKDMRTLFKGRDRVTMYELLECGNENIVHFANLLYEKAFKTYSSKQWGIPIDQIDRSVINRVQFCIGFDSRYLNKDFQFLPKNGFSALFLNMLNHEKIHLHTSVDAIEHIRFLDEKVLFDEEEVDLLIYTGGIDELFNFKFGKLPYRTLEFKHQYYKCDKYLPCEIISYPQAKGYTRSTEYKYFSFNCSNKSDTVVVTEYPHDYDISNPKRNIPCYPVINKTNMDIYEKYYNESKKYHNIFLCGRLAEYKYYNMDLVIESTFQKFEIIKKYLEDKLK